MQWLRDLSLRQKLFLGILSTCMTAMLLGASALFWFQSVTFQTAFVAEVKALSAMVARNGTAPLIFGDRRSGAEVLQSLKVKPQVLHAQMFNERGELFAQIGSEPMQWPWREQAGTEPIFVGQGYARLILPIPIDEASQGRLEVIAYYGDEQKKLFALFGWVMAGIFIVSLMVILVMSNFIQRLITRPIISLVDLAQDITEKEEYHNRAVEQSRDEVGVLTRAFNQMLDRIQSREAGLRESQQRYEVAVLGSSDGLWDHDLINGHVYFSPRWKAMIGYEDHELTNTAETFLALLHPNDLPAVNEKVSAYLKGHGPSYEAEFRMRHKDGSYRWILSRGAALRNENHQPIRFAGSHTDITERKLVELEIRVAREKFEVLVNSIDGVVWEACIDNRSFTFVSPQAERLLGYPLKQWTEDRTFWIDHLHPADRENTLRITSEAIAKRQATRSEYRMIAADGREVEAVAGRLRYTAPMDMSGHPTLTLPGGMTRDAVPTGFQIAARAFDE
ncbi:MAG TPA: PAS domain-containing protein, partial [Opitutaceae bacterium]|nr:PAS domain-containing protein [Opitutaceae bacterium]